MTTPEEKELQKRIDRIFSPYAMSQMEDYFRKQQDPNHVRFVHYTSAAAALQIVQKKRVWMRNVTCMSDFSEVQHGYRILLKIFSEPANQKAFKEALDACATGGTEEVFKMFDSWWNDISLNTYITSIAEHDRTEDQHGRLSMWRAFGGNDVRVALVFKIPVSLVDAGVFNLVFSPVAYLTDPEVEDKFHQVVQNICGNSEFLRSIGRERVILSAFNMLTASVTCLKHDGFKEEHEWRLIYGPKRWASSLIESSTEVVGGIPQVVYKIPFDATATGVPNDFDLARLFDLLIIGPSVYPWSMVEAFVTAFKSAGVAESEKRIVLSRIPIRM